MTEQIGRVTIHIHGSQLSPQEEDGTLKEVCRIVQRTQDDGYTEKIVKEAKWPLLYHLSPMRENILSWFPFPSGLHVLELGAECGAVTGAFLRKGLQVTAVDPSPDKCRINALRYGSSENLRIEAGDVEEILPELGDRYDVITLIETENGFCGKSETEGTIHRLFELALNLLKPDGCLWIAAENPFGLRLSAGCRGLDEGERLNGNVRRAERMTRKRWIRAAERFGLDWEFYYPYPDHFLPVKLFSDAYLPHQGELDRGWQFFHGNRFTLFDEREMFDTVLEEGLFPEMANAFLISFRRKESH